MIRAKVCAAVIIEIAYAVFTRTWLRQHAQGVELELLTSALRIVSAAAYWLMFRELVLGRPLYTASLRHPLVLAAAAAVLATPFLSVGWSPDGGLGAAVVFALTSVIVGVREELLYRAVLFNLLEPRMGLAGTVALSTGAFLVYHYGALPVAPPVIAEVVIMSVVLGLIYARSGSLLVVTAMHATYDGIECFGAYLNPPIPYSWRPAFLLMALVLVFLWLWRVGQARPPVSGDAHG